MTTTTKITLETAKTNLNRARRMHKGVTAAKQALIEAKRIQSREGLMKSARRFSTLIALMAV